MKPELDLGTFERNWYLEHVKKDSSDYSMDGELSGYDEKVIGNNLVLAGPMIDGYLKEIGRALLNKLSRGN